MPTLDKNKSAASPMKTKLKKVIGNVAKKISAKNGVKIKGAKNGVANGMKAAGKAVAKAANKAATAVKAAAGKRVYFFGGGKAEGNKEMKNLLGGKGANLAEMANIGLPVPPGFTITTEVCTEFYANGKKLPKTLDADVRASIARMEKLVGAKFGDPSNPLLVSVRSGARASMPGMMDTILNLGLNDKTAAGLAEKSGNERFAFDSYRRFIAMYGDVVLGLKPEKKEDHDPFDEILARKKQERGVKLDSDLPADALKELVQEFKDEIKERVGVSTSPRIPTCSSRARSRRSFSRGRTTAPTFTAASTTSRRSGARRSTSRRWCSATRAPTRRPASASRATRPAARTCSTASSW